MTINKILDQLKLLVDSYQTLTAAEEYDSNAGDNLKTSFAALRDVIEPSETVATRVAGLNRNNYKDRLQSVKALGFPETGDDEVDLGEFFRDVSDALIDAQRRLDSRSLAYSDQAPPGIAKSHFAIPSVKAEMKVGLRKEREKKLNLIFIGGKNKKEEFAESTVSFELISAPPPPGEAVPSVPGFLIPDPGRGAVLAAVEPCFVEGLKRKLDLSIGSSAVCRHRRTMPGEPVEHLVISKIGTDNAAEFVAGAFTFKDGLCQRETGFYTKGTAPPGGVVHVPHRAHRQNNMLKSALTGLVHNIGDLLMKAVVLMHDWLAEPSLATGQSVVLEGAARDSALRAAESSLEGRARSYEESAEAALVIRERSAGAWGPLHLVLWPIPQASPGVWKEIAATTLTSSRSGFRVVSHLQLRNVKDLGTVEVLQPLATDSAELLGILVGILQSWQIGGGGPVAS